MAELARRPPRKRKASEEGVCEFESHRFRQIDCRIAQLVVRRPVKADVAGSSPVPAARLKGECMTERDKKLWQQMADMTLEQCRKKCHSLGSCCSPEYCEMAAEFMRKAGHKFPQMPFGKTFVVDGKCIVPPHFRPLCSLQQCDIGGLGFAKDDPAWTKQYFALREKLEKTMVE